MPPLRPNPPRRASRRCPARWLAAARRLVFAKISCASTRIPLPATRLPIHALRPRAILRRSNASPSLNAHPEAVIPLPAPIRRVSAYTRSWRILRAATMAMLAPSTIAASAVCAAERERPTIFSAWIPLVSSVAAESSFPALASFCADLCLPSIVNRRGRALPRNATFRRARAWRRPSCAIGEMAARWAFVTFWTDNANISLPEARLQPPSRMRPRRRRRHRRRNRLRSSTLLSRPVPSAPVHPPRAEPLPTRI